MLGFSSKQDEKPLETEQDLIWSFKFLLAAEQHMDCRGSQRGSRETSSLCNNSLVTWMRVVAVGIEGSGQIWTMLHLGLAAGDGERCKNGLVDAWWHL